jgi:hypothetical protein
MRRKYGYLFTGWFWYLGMLVPVIGIVQVGLQGHADRYTYLPQIGLYLIVTWGIVDLTAGWRYGREFLSVAAALVIGALTWDARTQTTFWRDGETLYRHALAVTNRNDVAHTELGEFLMSHNRAGEAIEHLQKAMAIRSALEADPKAHNLLGIAFFKIGDPRQGIAHSIRALEIDPHNSTAESNLAWAYATSPDASTRDGAQAVKMMEDVLQRPGARSALFLHTLAAAYAESGRFPEAITTAQEALDLAAIDGNEALAADLRNNIKSYQHHVPLRDPSLSSRSPRS